MRREKKMRIIILDKFYMGYVFNLFKVDGWI